MLASASHATHRCITRSLPLFPAECFGAALVDCGIFGKETGCAIAPPVMRYEAGEWFTNIEWIKTLRAELSQQPGAWISSLVAQSIERAQHTCTHVGRSSPSSAEHLAHDLCQLHSVMAPPALVCHVLEEVLDERLKHILSSLHFSEEEQGMWMELFQYPARETERLRERDAFLRLAQFVKTHALSRPTRRAIDAFLDRFGFLGRLSGLKRPYTYVDLMKRIATVPGIPADLEKAEAHARREALERIKDFFTRTGLSASDRDAIRAFSDIAFWRLREEELWALIETFTEQAKHRLAAFVNGDPNLVLFLRPEELTQALVNQKENAWKEAEERKERGYTLVVTADHVLVSDTP